MPADKPAGRNPTPIIATFIAEEIAYDRGTAVELDEPLLEGLLDSLDVLSVATFLERTFSIRIDDDDVLADNFRTVRGMAEMIERKTGAEAGP